MTRAERSRPARIEAAPEGNHDDDQPTPTIQVPEVITQAEARRLTDQIKAGLDHLADAYETVIPFVAEAFRTEAWVPLGYRRNGSSRWIEDNFGGALGRLSIQLRREIGARIDAEIPGIGQRGVAALVGVDQATVARDVGAESDADASGLVTGKETRESGRRGPWPEAARGVTHELSKITVRIRNLVNDDRFAKYKHGSEVAWLIREVDQAAREINELREQLVGLADDVADEDRHLRDRR